jgi:hypothetical protein
MLEIKQWKKQQLKITATLALKIHASLASLCASAMENGATSPNSERWLTINLKIFASLKISGLKVPQN